MNAQEMAQLSKVEKAVEGIRKRLDAQAEERVLTAKDEKDIMLKILGVVDEFRETGVTCKNVAETKNLANDNTLLQVR